MATLFGSIPGTAIRLDLKEGDVALPLSVDGIANGWFPGFKSILTEVSLGLDGNYQFVHTLKSIIYIYTFGDRISQLRLGGLAFQAACNAGQGTGIEALLGYYEQNRIAARSQPIQVQIGTEAAGRFRGYLTHFKADLLKPEARITYFSLLLHVIPGGTT